MALSFAVVAQTTPGPVGPAEIPDLLPSLLRVGWFLAGFVLVVLVGRVVVEPLLARGLRARNQNNATLVEAVSRYLRLFVVVLAVFVGAGAAGYGGFVSDSALVVAAGTLAVGVAGQTVIGSLVSGVVLVADPEFNVGNYIEWDEGEGVVRSITLRVTRVQTPDGTLVTVPNTHLTSQAVARPYGHGRTRVVERVDVAYEDEVEAALAGLRDAAGDVDGIAAEPSPNAYVDEFGGDAVVLAVHYWVENPRTRNQFEIRSAYARAAKARLDAAGITISPASKRELPGRVEVGNDGGEAATAD
ncbi:MAG: mechanosensitive ion channel domain-containing protein [Haloferacaceae archaeon]